MDQSRWLKVPIVLRCGTISSANQDYKLLRGEAAFCFYPDGSRPPSLRVGDGVSKWSALSEVAPVWSVNNKVGNVGIVIADIPNLQSTLDSKQDVTAMPAAVATIMPFVKIGFESMTLNLTGTITRAVSIPGISASTHVAFAHVVTNGGITLLQLLTGGIVAEAKITANTLTLSIRPTALLTLTSTVQVNYQVAELYG